MPYPRIHLTSLPPTRRTSVIQKVEALGGCVLDPNHNQFNESCTHVVVFDNDTKPTERVLAALAAGIWIVRITWIESSSICGYWLAEEPHECQVGGGLPRYHRLRARAANAAAAASGCLISGSDTSLTKIQTETKAGAIFAGWTIFIQVQKSSTNRSFRRVLAAGGAYVVRACDLSVPGVSERLNLVLTDDESLPTIKQQLAPGTPVARHLFLRDVLLQKVDTADVSKYIYPPDFNASVRNQGSSTQPVLVDIVCSPAKIGSITTSTPHTARRPATLRRRNRQSSATPTSSFALSGNRSITEFFASIEKPVHRGPTTDDDVVVILDDDDDVLSTTITPENSTVLPASSATFPSDSKQGIRPVTISSENFGLIISDCRTLHDTSSEVIVLNEDDDMVEGDGEVGGPCRKKLKVESGVTVKKMAPAMCRARGLNIRHSVDSEDAADDDGVISLEMDDNDDIQVVSRDDKASSPSLLVMTNVAGRSQGTGDNVSLNDEGGGGGGDDDEDADCYITEVTPAVPPVLSRIRSRLVLKSESPMVCEEVVLDDDDCCIMDVVPQSVSSSTRGNGPHQVPKQEPSAKEGDRKLKAISSSACNLSSESDSGDFVVMRQSSPAVYSAKTPNSVPTVNSSISTSPGPSSTTAIPGTTISWNQTLPPITSAFAASIRTILSPLILSRKDNGPIQDTTSILKHSTRTCPNRATNHSPNSRPETVSLTPVNSSLRPVGTITNPLPLNSIRDIVNGTKNQTFISSTFSNSLKKKSPGVLNDDTLSKGDGCNNVRNGNILFPKSNSPTNTLVTDSPGDGHPNNGTTKLILSNSISEVSADGDSNLINDKLMTGESHPFKNNICNNLTVQSKIIQSFKNISPENGICDSFNRDPIIDSKDSIASLPVFDTKPLITKLLVTKPSETKPLNSKPLVTKQVLDEKHLVTKPTETEPLDIKPLDEKHLNTNTLESKLLDTKPSPTNATSGSFTSSTGDRGMSCKPDSSSGKIPQNATLHIIGSFLEVGSSFSEAFSGNLMRAFPTGQLSELLLPHSREQTKGETGLYWSSVRSTGRLGIDVSALNSLSVMGGVDCDATCTHSNVSVTGRCVNCHVAVENLKKEPEEEKEKKGGRGLLVDENDVDVVVNSLMWLKLGITSLHYPNSELIGDMLARYVIKCGIPMVQAQALSVAQHVLSIRPLISSVPSITYYTRLLRAVAAAVADPAQVPIGDTLWTLVDVVCDQLNIAVGNDIPSSSSSLDGPGGSSAPAAEGASGGGCKKRATTVSFERWQYEQHLLDMLAVVLAILEQDLNVWKANVRPVEELISYRLLLGYSNNPAVLPKTAVKLVKLWVGLSPHVTSNSTTTALRPYVTQLVGLLFELVWLWHCQRQAEADRQPGTPLKSGGGKPLSGTRPGSASLADIMAAGDARFAPLTREMALAFRGVSEGAILFLIREMPLARHRLFLSGVVTSAAQNQKPTAGSVGSTSTDGTGDEDGTKMLQTLAKDIIATGESCPENTSDRAGGAPPHPSSASLPQLSGPSIASWHVGKVQLLLLQLHAYLQVTGSVYVVKKAVKETLKKKKKSLNSACGAAEGIGGSIANNTKGSSDLNNTSENVGKSTAEGVSPGQSTIISERTDGFDTTFSSTSTYRTNLEYYDIFGNVYSKEYLQDHFKRFSSDRKVLTTLQCPLRKVINTCKHANVLQLLMTLLYMK